MSMGDCRCSTVESANGQTSDGTREGVFTRYLEGLRIRPQFVLPRFKDSIPATALARIRETKLSRTWLS